jgi:hypothetical protein
MSATFVIPYVRRSGKNYLKFSPLPRLTELKQQFDLNANNHHSLPGHSALY